MNSPNILSIKPTGLLEQNQLKKKNDSSILKLNNNSITGTDLKFMPVNVAFTSNIQRQNTIPEELITNLTDNNTNVRIQTIDNIADLVRNNDNLRDQAINVLARVEGQGIRDNHPPVYEHAMNVLRELTRSETEYANLIVNAFIDSSNNSDSDSDNDNNNDNNVDWNQPVGIVG